MQTSECPNCGAPVDAQKLHCPFCSAGLATDRELDLKRREDLEVFVKVIEERLAGAKDAYGGTIAVVFVALVCALIGGGVALVYSTLAWYASMGIFIGGVFTFFLAFGGAVTVLEARGVVECYHGQLNADIEKYLAAAEVHRHELDTVAAKVLPKDALFRRFLFN